MLMLVVQLDQVHSQQSTSLSLTNSMPTMEVAMLVHSIQKIVSVRLATIVLLTVITSHGTGTLRCMQKEMATYRHWSVSLWRDPDDVPHCRILSPDKTEWQLISAALCGWRCCFVADQLWFMTHTRRRRLPRLVDCQQVSFVECICLVVRLQ